MSGTAETTLLAPPAGSWAKRQDNPMILRIVDYRDCSPLEYVPGRNSGTATFIGRRIPVQTLADWLSTGQTLEAFSDTFGIDIGDVRAVHEYMTDSPPVGTVDLTGCGAVELNPRGIPTFVGNVYPPVEALFDFFMAGRTARDFSDAYDVDVDYEYVEAVVRHAADQDYPGPLG